MTRAVHLVVSALLASCGAGGPDTHQEASAAATVVCSQAALTQVEDVVAVSGVVAPLPRFDAMIGSQVAGRVSHLVVEEGDQVAAGALIAIIDDPALPSGAIEARASVKAAEAADLAATQDLSRLHRLVEDGLVARRSLEEGSARAAAARADLDSANARSGLARSSNARRELRAPFAGTVLHVWKHIGEAVDGTAATPVAEVANVSELELRAQLPASLLLDVRVGMKARVELAPGTLLTTGRVVRVAPAVDSSTLLQGVRIALDGGPAVAVGTPAIATITIATRPGVLISSSAVRRSPVGTDEVVVCDKGVARVRHVDVRRRDETSTEVLAGLKSGELVVIDHALGLEDGQPLAVAPRGPVAEVK